MTPPRRWELVVLAVVISLGVALGVPLYLYASTYQQAERRFGTNSDIILAAITYRQEHGAFPLSLALVRDGGALPSYERHADGASARVVLNDVYVVELSAENYTFTRIRH